MATDLGALTMFDSQLGRLVQELKDSGVYDNTVIFYTSDNGPHQGSERRGMGENSILWSSNFLRQCKASNLYATGFSRDRNCFLAAIS